MINLNLTPEELNLLKQTVDQTNFPGSISHVVTTVRQKLLTAQPEPPKEEKKNDGGDKKGDKRD